MHHLSGHLLFSRSQALGARLSMVPATGSHLPCKDDVEASLAWLLLPMALKHNFLPMGMPIFAL